MSHSDEDYILALQLQEQLNEQNTFDQADQKVLKSPSLVDPYWEMTDPNPDVRALFLQFNERFFWGRLAGIEVRWSPRMTLCAGLCCYEGRGGLCSVRLSVPLLKLRPRKDLVETLLHEMIHAYLFVTENNKDHDGHGPEFHKHMYRINKEAGTNISVYHNFHDEVESYRQHWWRCDGPCRSRKPYFGYVKRTMNRAPSKNDTWWAEHQRTCGGSYTKVKEPEDYGKKKAKDKQQGTESKENKKEVKSSVKSMDIRIFGGKGVTLSGQKPASPSSIKSSSSTTKKPPSATVTSDDQVQVDDKGPSDCPGVVAQKTSDFPNSFPSVCDRNLSHTDGKLSGKSGIFVKKDSKVSTGHNKHEKESSMKDKSSLKVIEKSKFSLSDFSDSDDDLLCSIPEEQISGKETDMKRSSSIERGGYKIENGMNFDKEKVEVDKTNGKEDDVRAMLRKVWGEKNIGSNTMQKRTKTAGNFRTKATDTSSKIKESITIDNRHRLNNKTSHQPALVNKRKDVEHCKDNKEATWMPVNDKKRSSTFDDCENLPVSKRLKEDSVETIDISGSKDRHKNQSFREESVYDKHKHFTDTVGSQGASNDRPLDSTAKSKTSLNSNDSKLFDKIKNLDKCSSPEKVQHKAENTVKSPIERLFDKLKDKHKAAEKQTSDTVILRDHDSISVIVEDKNSKPDHVVETSACPVCNENVPTASINEHLDLCLTLKVL